MLLLCLTLISPFAFKILPSVRNFVICTSISILIASLFRYRSFGILSGHGVCLREPRQHGLNEETLRVLRRERIIRAIQTHADTRLALSHAKRATKRDFVLKPALQNETFQSLDNQARSLEMTRASDAYRNIHAQTLSAYSSNRNRVLFIDIILLIPSLVNQQPVRSKSNQQPCGLHRPRQSIKKRRLVRNETAVLGVLLRLGASNYRVRVIRLPLLLIEFTGLPPQNPVSCCSIFCFGFFAALLCNGHENLHRPDCDKSEPPS